MPRGDWEWTIRFQEKQPGLVRARFEELRLEEPIASLISANAVSLVGDTLVTGRGRDAHAVIVDAFNDVAYGWWVESGPTPPASTANEADEVG